MQHFPDIQALRKEEEICLVNLARGKDVFAILPTDFGKSLIFSSFHDCDEIRNVNGAEK